MRYLGAPAKSKKALAKQQAIRMVRMYQKDPNPPTKRPGLESVAHAANFHGLLSNIIEPIPTILHELHKPRKQRDLVTLGTMAGGGGFGGKEAFDQALVKRLNTDMQGTRPENGPHSWFDSSHSDFSLDFMPFVKNDSNKQSYNLNNALLQFPHMDSGVNFKSVTRGNELLPYMRILLARSIKKPNQGTTQNTLLERLMYDLYGPGNRRGN